MNLGYEIRERFPEKTAMASEFMKNVFGSALPESEEFDTICLLFRTPSGGLIALPETLFADYTNEQIEARLDTPDVIAKIAGLKRGERFMVYAG